MPGKQLLLADEDTPLALSAAECVCRCVKNHNPEVAELHVHHIWPLGEGGPRQLDNEVFLCPTMHSNVHRALRALLAGRETELRNPHGVVLLVSGYTQIMEARRDRPA